MIKTKEKVKQYLRNKYFEMFRSLNPISSVSVHDVRNDRQGTAHHCEEKHAPVHSFILERINSKRSLQSAHNALLTAKRNGSNLFLFNKKKLLFIHFQIKISVFILRIIFNHFVLKYFLFKLQK